MYLPPTLFKINLQLFSEEPSPSPEPGPSSNPLPSPEPTPEPVEGPPSFSSASANLLKALENPEGNPVEEPSPDPVIEEPKPQDPSPEPVKDPKPEPENVKPVINDDLKNYLDSLKSDILESVKPKEIPKPQEPEPPKEDPKPTEEEIQQMNEDLYNRFMDNPMEVLKEFQEKAEEKALNKIKEEFKPILEEKEQIQQRKEVDSIIDNYMSNNQDALNYVDDMAKIISDEKLSHKDAKALDYAYHKAKATKLSQMPTAKSFDEMLADETNIEKVLQNEGITKQVIENYLKSLSAKGKPVTIGSTPAKGETPITPPREKFRTFGEASKAFKASLQ